MPPNRASFKTLARTRALVLVSIAVIPLAACTKNSKNAGLERCNDGESCYKQAQALVAANFEDRAATDNLTKEKSAKRAAQAAAFFQQGCDLGNGECCNLLGWWLERGGLGPKDLPRAIRLQERGCDELKEFRACDSLAQLYRNGRGVPKDPALQAKYHQLACDLAEPPMAKTTYCNPDH